jgi:hypothetical protein
MELVLAYRGGGEQAIGGGRFVVGVALGDVHRASDAGVVGAGVRSRVRPSCTSDSLS